jgi:DNA-binding CsgD family transcriptional regulator
LFRTGDWLGALGTANEAVELARETKQSAELALALVTALRIEAATGRVEGARERANEVLPICETVGMRFFEMSAFAALGFFELSMGNFAAAKALLMRDQVLADAFSVQCSTVEMWQPDLVDAAVMLGDRAFGREVSTQLTADARRNAIPYAFALAARCRGTVADDLGEARAEFEAALGWHDEVADPFQRARTELAYGERLVAESVTEEGARALLSAATTFARLGAVPWQRRALRHVPEADRDAVGGTALPSQLLSPRELQVALLVVDGRTSRDVANELFLSRRTVDFHLAAIYRKLGVSNRTHLARVLYPRVEPTP